MKIKKGHVIIGILILVVAGGIGVWMKSKASKSEDKDKIINPHYGSLQTVINTTASVLPKNRLEIKPTVGGRVQEILVKEGDMVKTGQILAWMSSTDRAALLDSARGQGEKEFKYWQDVYKPIPLMAPIDGQVIVATTQPGQTVSIIDPIIVLSDHLIVRAQVDETDIGKIKLNQQAIVSLDAYPDQKIEATVEHLYYESKTVNNVTTYEVDLLAKELPAFFRSGMNASVDFITQKKDHVLQIPVTAIIKKKDQSFVLLKSPKNSKGVMKEIQTGISDDKNIEVTQGLKEDDDIIVKQKKYSLNPAKGGSNPFMAGGRAGSGGGNRGR